MQHIRLIIETGVDLRVFRHGDDQCPGQKWQHRQLGLIVAALGVQVLA